MVTHARPGPFRLVPRVSLFSSGVTLVKMSGARWALQCIVCVSCPVVTTLSQLVRTVSEMLKCRSRFLLRGVTHTHAVSCPRHGRAAVVGF